MILLFTDFGYEGPYLGQMKAVLSTIAPDKRVIDLMHDAPAHNPHSAAYLLASLVSEMPPNAVCLAVVDPGVGSSRPPIVLRVDGRWFVGPDNGLFELVQRRAHKADQWVISWRPKKLSVTFHGRDLFAPVAARLALGGDPPGCSYPAGWRLLSTRPGADWPNDNAIVVYIDRYGNAMTGLRASLLDQSQALIVGEFFVEYAAGFSEMSPGRVFWYANSCGLVEIAANRANASAICGLDIGDEFTITA